MATIANMTPQELTEMIERVAENAVDRRLRELLGEFEIAEDELFTDDDPETRTLEEIYESIERNRWTPPPSAPTPVEMLREDRDR